MARTQLHYCTSKLHFFRGVLAVDWCTPPASLSPSTFASKVKPLEVAADTTGADCHILPQRSKALHVSLGGYSMVPVAVLCGLCGEGMASKNQLLFHHTRQRRREHPVDACLRAAQQRFQSQPFVPVEQSVDARAGPFEVGQALLGS